MTGQAVADGSLASRVIVAGHTDGIRAAGIRFAEILLGKGATAHEGIASHVARATADGCQTAQIAIGSNAAGSLAGVFADAIEACGSSSWAIYVTITLRPTFRVSAANVPLGAITHCTVIGHCLATGPSAALAACWDALVVAAHVTATTVAIVLALVPAAAQRIAQIAVQAGACWHAVDNLALGVDAAWAGMALFLCKNINIINIDYTGIASICNDSGRHCCPQVRA